MDYPTHLSGQHEDALNALARQAQALRQARSKRKQGKEKIAEKANELLCQIQHHSASRLGQDHAINILYQESGLSSEVAANELRAAWQQAVVRKQKRDVLGDEIEQWNMTDFVQACEEPEPELAILPVGSWFLHFSFTLAKPYISRDDKANHLIDNPVTKDRVLGLPLIGPSSWKGNLRSALRLFKGWEADDQPEMIGLFGNPKGTESDFRAGRLEFYPTFFYRIGLEIINPHDRARKVGKNPLLIECVPAGATGTFSLLYVPFDLIGQPVDEIGKVAKADLQLVAEAVSAMMLTYGFSAKRTSGYGTAQDEIAGGVVRTRAGEWRLTRVSQLAQEVEDVRF